MMLHIRSDRVKTNYVLLTHGWNDDKALVIAPPCDDNCCWHLLTFNSWLYYSMRIGYFLFTASVPDEFSTCVNFHSSPTCVLSQREMSRTTGVPQVPSKRSYAVFVRATVLHTCHVGNYNVLGCVRKGSSLAQGLRGHLLKTITSKEDHVFQRISRQRSFLSAVQNQGGPDKAKCMPCCCPHGPRTFSSDWISP